jgi:hypothetical protein
MKQRSGEAVCSNHCQRRLAPSQRREMSHTGDMRKINHLNHVSYFGLVMGDCHRLQHFIDEALTKRDSSS